MVFGGLFAVQLVVWILLHRYVWRVTETPTTISANDDLPEERCWKSTLIARSSIFLALNTFVLAAFFAFESKPIAGTETSLAETLVGSEHAEVVARLDRWLFALSIPAGFAGYLLGCWALVRSRKRSLKRNTLVSFAGIALNLIVISYWVVFAWHVASPLVEGSSGSIGASGSSVAKPDLPEPNLLPPPEPLFPDGDDEPGQTSPKRRKTGAVRNPIETYPRFYQDSEVEKFARRYEAKGFERKVGQVLEINEPIDTPTIFFGQRIEINSGASAEIILIGQSLTINSRVTANVSCLGQVLHIGKNGIVEGDVNSLADEKARINKPFLQSNGQIKGDVTGPWH